MAVSTHALNITVRASTNLGRAAATLVPGQSVELDSAGTQVFCNNGNEPFVYWNNKFYWDEIRREAQAIGIGTGFTRCRHARYADDDDQWYATASYDTPVEWQCNNLGHPYEWHTMTPDGTYWCKRSTLEELQFRRRSDWSSSPWSAADKTPSFVTPSTSWPESLEWHHALGKALFRIGGTVISLDLMQFLATGVWEYQKLSIAPSSSTANKSSIRYCQALRSCVAFGVNDGVIQDDCHLIRPDGSMETMISRPPRWVQNGNIVMQDTAIDRFCVFVDDPNKQTAYLLERQPLSYAGDRRVWRMNNSGETWDGSWTEVGTTDVFTKPRTDGLASGAGSYFCPITSYGVVWVLRQSSIERCDSFLWKPPV